MSKHDDDAVAKALAVLVSIPLSVVIRAWVLTVMWGWYVVPMGAAQVGMAHAAGISLIVGYLTSHGSYQDPEKTLMDKVVEALVGPLVALLFGWMIHAFM